jgi:hypothetical protein
MTRPNRGMRVPRYAFYLALLLIPLLGLGLFPIGDGTGVAAWGQEAPQTTSPDSTQTTAPETTESTSTATSTIEPCATTTTGTGATEPCPPPTTTGQPAQQARDDLQAITPDVVVASAAAGGTTVQDATSILTTTKDAPTSVAVAKQPGGDVKVTGAGTAMDVGLPAAPAATPARVGGNLAVFATPDRGRAAVAVQPKDTGARVMVIIRSPEDPQTYRFPVQIPAGGRLVPMAGGKSGAQPGEQEATRPATPSSTAAARASAASPRPGRRMQTGSRSAPGTPRSRARSSKAWATSAPTTRWSPTRCSASAAPGPAARCGSPPR